MASQKQSVRDALCELEGLYKSREKIEAKRAKEVAPHQSAFDEATREILSKYTEQVSPVNVRIVALEKEVAAQMLAKLDASGNLKLNKVESEKLIAEAMFTQSREVSPETFVNTARGKAGFWDCVSVLIGKAETLLGKSELDKITKLKRKYSVSIRAK